MSSSLFEEAINLQRAAHELMYLGILAGTDRRVYAVFVSIRLERVAEAGWG